MLVDLSILSPYSP